MLARAANSVWLVPPSSSTRLCSRCPVTFAGSLCGTLPGKSSCVVDLPTLTGSGVALIYVVPEIEGLSRVQTAFIFLRRNHLPSSWRSARAACAQLSSPEVRAPDGTS